MSSNTDPEIRRRQNREAGRRFSRRHPERIREWNRRYDLANPDKARARRLAWVKANPDRAKANRKAWFAKNKASLNAARLKTRRMPKWANWFFIQEIYELARLRTELTGVPWEVDHVIPLTHHLVSGLHVEQNLRVIPRSVNRAKKNFFEIGSHDVR